MNDDKIKSAIESILFIWAEPISLDEIANVLDINKSNVKKNLDKLIDEYKNSNGGIQINVYDDYYQMYSNIENEKYIKKLVNSPKRRITNSTMEVLAIIAYKQPITRIEIDNIRGVKSYSSIDTLKSRGLIQEVGKSNAIGKPILYGTTIEFLKSFNIENLSQLPEIQDIEKLDIVKEEEYED